MLGLSSGFCSLSCLGAPQTRDTATNASGVLLWGHLARWGLSSGFCGLSSGTSNTRHCYINVSGILSWITVWLFRGVFWFLWPLLGHPKHKTMLSTPGFSWGALWLSSGYLGLSRPVFRRLKHETLLSTPLGFCWGALRVFFGAVLGLLLGLS